MIAIPRDKPDYCRVCHERLKCKQYDGEILHTPDDCPLIEIIPCKECIYNTNNTDGDDRGWCYKHGIDIIGFCSEGE